MSSFKNMCAIPKIKPSRETLAYHLIGSRYYDPLTASWLSRDPVAQFHSPYVYAGNGFNPISAIDPDGLRIGKIITLTTSGHKSGRIIGSLDEAVELMKKGFDVLFDSRKYAHDATKTIGAERVKLGLQNSKQPISDKGHKIFKRKDEYGRAHYHVASRPKGIGHAFYSISLFFFNRMDLEFLAIRSTLQSTYGDDYSIDFNDAGQEVWEWDSGVIVTPSDVQINDNGITIMEVDSDN